MSKIPERLFVGLEIGNIRGSCWIKLGEKSKDRVRDAEWCSVCNDPQLAAGRGHLSFT